MLHASWENHGTLYNGDCLEVMKDIPDKSVDMILCDLPYGTTYAPWDSVIPFDSLWAHYRRVIKRGGGGIILTGSQPFTSALVMSNPQWFRYSWVWDKVNRYTGSLNANKRPLKRHEDVLVFYEKQPTYNKQWRDGAPYTATNTKGHGKHTRYGHELDSRVTINDGRHNPCSILPFAANIKTELGLHPTQKPVALFEYLIKTYTNEGETVLDNCIGSGTTAIAAINTGRKFIGIEKDDTYVQVAKDRIDGHLSRLAERDRHITLFDDLGA